MRAPARHIRLSLTRLRGLAAAVLLSSIAAIAAGCTPLDHAVGIIFGRSMRNQPSFDPYENPRLPPAGSIPFAAGEYPSRGGVEHAEPRVSEEPAPFTQAELDAIAARLANPVRPTDESLARGRVLFRRNCAPCHGTDAAGVTGSVIPAGFPPFPLLTDRVRNFTDGYIYGMIRVGRGVMPVYGERVSHRDRWHIVNYLRELQRVSPFAPEPLPPFAVAKADALIRDRLPCLGCHRLGDEGGRMGPDLTGLGMRAGASYVRAVIEDPAMMVPGTIMPKVPMRPETLDLIAAYLVQRRGVPEDTAPAVQPPPAPPMGAQARSGEALYRAYCAPCHGPDGRGDGYNAPHLPARPVPHADSALMSRRPDDTLFDGIYAGGRILGRSHRMPAFGETLSRTEIRALVAYIRQLCRCLGPAWSRDGARPTS
ncbi:MAG: c-type cytochrome [Gemmatimonadetes bacterium]|nr:c-type cytochrome [Gemmatimonadota bacterium]